MIGQAWSRDLNAGLWLAHPESPPQLVEAGQPDLSSPALCYHNNGRREGILRKDPNKLGVQCASAALLALTVGVKT